MAKKLALLILVFSLAIAAYYLHRAADDVAALTGQTELAPARSRSGGSGAPFRVSLSRDGFSSSVIPPVDAPAPADEPEGLPPDVIPGEEVLMFYDDTHLRAFLDIAAVEGLDIVGRIDSLRAVRVRRSDESALRRALTRSPAPIARGPNHFVRQPDPPADPPEGVIYSPFGDAAAAWLGAAADRARWGEGITVAVLDTDGPTAEIIQVSD